MSDYQTFVIKYDVVQKRQAVVSAVDANHAIERFRDNKCDNDACLFEDIGSDGDLQLISVDTGGEWFYFGSSNLLSKLR